MFYSRTAPLRSRRGVILLVVLALLTLFAVVGITFVLYADAEAQSARLAPEAQSQDRPDVEPELLLAYFLGQLIYDTNDQRGVYSALRGHSLARLMYGFNDESENLTPRCSCQLRIPCRCRPSRFTRPATGTAPPRNV